MKFSIFENTSLARCLFALSRVTSALFLLALLSLRCEPISLPEPATDYYRQAFVNAFFAPETVGNGERIVVQVNYRNEHGSTLYHLSYVWESDSGRITLSPILHFIPETGGNIPLSYKTVIDSFKLDTMGLFQLNVGGSQIHALKKMLFVDTSAAHPDNYALHVHYLDTNNVDLSYQVDTLRFPDLSQTVVITADAAGVWDTVFVDPAAKRKFSFGTFQFEATKGVRTSGIIIR